jgi:hypothetical protein
MARLPLNRRRVVWHIGPSDPGTAFLADALQQHSDELATLGVAVPQGPWHEVEDQIWKHKGLSLLSTPDIARADKQKVGLRLAGLRDIELHLVVLVRDLPSQVFTGWQTAIQRGSTTSLKKYAARVLDPERSHWQAEEFWAGRDLSEFLPRWTRAIHADRVHVVAAPADADGVWAAYLRQAGIGDLVRPEVTAPPVHAAELDHERVLDITTGWAKLVAERGFDLQGSLIAPSLTTPRVATREEQFEAIAELLVATTAEVERLSTDVARLRAENARLDRKRRKHKRRVAELTERGS